MRTTEWQTRMSSSQMKLRRDSRKNRGKGERGLLILIEHGQDIPDILVGGGQLPTKIRKIKKATATARITIMIEM